MGSSTPSARPAIGRGAQVLAGLAAALAAALLTACAGAPPVVERPDALFDDRLFAPPTERVATDDLFAVDDAMRRYLTFDIARQIRREGPHRGLVNALAQKGQLKLEYDAERTKTAAQAFHARSGNCLSLVIMTAALAKELNLTVRYQSAIAEDTWSRAGDLLLLSGHVNLALGQRSLSGGIGVDASESTIDFLPPGDIRGLRTREIDERTVVAMYANNRAAEALVAGRADDAYAWSREALRSDPGFMSAYNTLGVIYLRRGHTAHAVRAFDRVLAAQPRNTRTLANQIEALERLGRQADAAPLRTRLASLEPLAPFHDFNLGVAAMQRGDYRAARDWFAREVARTDYYHEFYFWLSLAEWRLGDVAAADRHLKLALSNSVTRGQHDLYAAKLAWLQSHRAQ